MRQRLEIGKTCTRQAAIRQIEPANSGADDRIELRDCLEVVIGIVIKSSNGHLFY